MNGHVEIIGKPINYAADIDASYIWSLLYVMTARGSMNSSTVTAFRTILVSFSRSNELFYSLIVATNYIIHGKVYIYVCQRLGVSYYE